MSFDQSDPNMYRTMSICSLGPTTVPSEKRSFARDTDPLAKDIDGSQPSNRYAKFLNKPSFYDTADVQGSKSMTLHKTRNGPVDNTLRVDDIDGARARVRDKFLQTNRHIDPLNPNYNLPSFSPAEPHVPKFIRDPLSISDIDGTKSTPLAKYDMRTMNKIDDIEGTQPSWKPRHARARLEAPPKDIMEVNDISKRTHRFKDHTTRVVDPVMPVYVVNGMEIMSDPKYTRPKKNPEFIADTHLLMTADIEGAYPGWHPPALLNPPLEMRREFRNTNFIKDIEGAQPNTIKRGITTERSVHPLDPVYQGLDAGVKLKGPVDPLIPATMYTKPKLTLKPQSDNARVRPASEVAMDTINLPGAYNGSSGMKRSNNMGRHSHIARPASEPAGATVAGSTYMLPASYADKLDDARGDLISSSGIAEPKFRDEDTSFPDSTVGRIAPAKDTSALVRFNSSGGRPPVNTALKLDLKAATTGSGAASSRQLSPWSSNSAGSGRVKMSPAERSRQDEIQSVRDLM